VRHRRAGPFSPRFNTPAGRASAYGNETRPSQNTPVLAVSNTARKLPFLNAEMHSGGGRLVGTIDDYLKFTEKCCARGGAGLLSPKNARLYDAHLFARRHRVDGARQLGRTTDGGHGALALGGAVVLNPRPRWRVPSSLGEISAWVAWPLPSLDLIRCLTCMSVSSRKLAPSSSYPGVPATQGPHPRSDA